MGLVTAQAHPGDWCANRPHWLPTLPSQPAPPYSQVLSVPACLSDPALASFDAQQCPGLLSMLDALQLGNTNPPAVCDLSCAQQFAQVGAAKAPARWPLGALRMVP